MIFSLFTFFLLFMNCSSAPNRGLAELLEYWPHIRKYLPNAILDVYYGLTYVFIPFLATCNALVYRPSALHNLEKKMGMGQFKIWQSKLTALLNQEGVSYYGMVSLILN